MRVVALLIVMILGTSACTIRFVRVRDNNLIEKYLKEINERNEKIFQIKASVMVKGIGLIDHLFHEQVDIVAAEPHFLRMSVRSFFESPSNIIASNGEFITIYDFSNSKSENYQSMPINSDSVIDIFNLKIHPALLVEVLLTHIPLKHATALELSEEKALVELKAELISGFQVSSIFDREKGVVIKTRLINSRNGQGFEVSYENYSDHQGILFPQTYVIRSIKAPHSFTFSMRIKSLELNGPTLSKENFYLPPS